MNTPTPKFTLGNKLRDRVSGIEGITTGYITFLNGCIQWNIHPAVGKDGKPTGEQAYYYDEQQLEKTGDGIAEKEPAKPKAPTGGAPTKVQSV